MLECFIISSNNSDHVLGENKNDTHILFDFLNEQA